MRLMLDSVKCFFGFHDWEYDKCPAPFRGRRNLSHYKTINGQQVMVMEQGPEEWFDPAQWWRPYKTCRRCQRTERAR